MKYYYYTKWLIGGVTYHSSWVTTDTPREFFASCLNDTIEIKVFQNREEMNNHAVSVGLPKH